MRVIRLRARRWVSAGMFSVAVMLSGCGETGSGAPPPPPVAVIPDDATGHYCGMYLPEHKGPKGQIMVRDRETPIWFTTIREVFAFTHMPEEPRAITATYVQDMVHVQPDGSFPEDAWIDAHNAWFLIESRFIGGMGVPDAVPFSDPDAAGAYQQKYGGHVVAFSDVPESYIFGPVQLPPDPPPANQLSMGVRQ